MFATFEPNIKVGINPDYGAIGEPKIVSELVHNTDKPLVGNYHVLQILVDDQGQVKIHDSLAQRYGEHLDPDVELHRIMLITAFVRYLPGFATFMSAIFEAMDDQPNWHKCPFDKLLSNAALAKAPEWLEDMYNEANLIDV